MARHSGLNVEPVLITQLSHFDSDSRRVTGERMYVEAALLMPNRWAFGFLTPTVKYRSVFTSGQHAKRMTHQKLAH